MTFNLADLSSLLAFKAHVTLDPQNAMATWFSATHFCNWFGVSSATGQHQIKGTVPPTSGNLSFLATFDIRNNSFHGYLPDELGQLLHLRMQRQQSPWNGSFEIG
uniref:Leucine-rich repeat-containing N-terminal plant-type domain-containing protein n=1 Tax=Salix viminalis TaxID=40686 RepID=A0A6N2KWC7_SALVM